MTTLGAACRVRMIKNQTKRFVITPIKIEPALPSIFWFTRQ